MGVSLRAMTLPFTVAVMLPEKLNESAMSEPPMVPNPPLSVTANDGARLNHHRLKPVGLKCG